MVTLWNIFCILAGILCYISFSAQIKQSNDKTLTCVGGYIGANIIFLLGFCFLQIIQYGFTSLAAQNLIFLFTNNTTIALIESLTLLTMSVLLAYLLDAYPLSQVTMVLQLGVPFGALFYYFAGNTTTPQELLGIALITLGALISGFKKFEFPNIFKPFFSISASLYTLATLRSIIGASGKMLMFIVSSKTTETIDIHHFLHNVDLLGAPNHYESATQFLLGRSPSIIAVFIFYLLYQNKFSYKQLQKKFSHDWFFVLGASILAATYTFLYYYVFQTIEHKSVLTALNKLKVPVAALLAWFIFKEKISFPKQVAIGLILLGGGLAAF